MRAPKKKGEGGWGWDRKSGKLGRPGELKPIRVGQGGPGKALLRLGEQI